MGNNLLFSIVIINIGRVFKLFDRKTVQFNRKFRLIYFVEGVLIFI